MHLYCTHQWKYIQARYLFMSVLWIALILILRWKKPHTSQPLCISSGLGQATVKHFVNAEDSCLAVLQTLCTFCSSWPRGTLRKDWTAASKSDGWAMTYKEWHSKWWLSWYDPFWVRETKCSKQKGSDWIFWALPAVFSPIIFSSVFLDDQLHKQGR